MTKRVYVAILVSAVLCGCSRQADEPKSASSDGPAADGPPQLTEDDRLAELNAEVGQVIQAASEAQLAENPDEAVRLLDEAIANPRYAEMLPELLREKMLFFLSTDDVAGAKALFEQYAADQPGFVMIGLRMIDERESTGENAAELLAWYKSLLAIEMDAGTDNALLNRALQLTPADAPSADLVELVSLSVEHLDETAGEQYVANVLRRVKERHADGGAVSLIDEIAAAFPDNAVVKQETHLSRVDLLVADGDFEAALAALSDNTAGVSAEAAGLRARSLVLAAAGQGALETVDAAIAAFPGVAAAANGAKIRYYIGAGDAASAETLLLEQLDPLGESVVTKLAQDLVDHLRSKSALAEAGRVAETIMGELGADHSAQGSLATALVGLDIEQQNFSGALDRLEAFAANGGGARVGIERSFRDLFYKIAVREKKDELARLAALANTFRDGSEKEWSRTRFANLALDASFMAEDYAACLKILADGVPGYDEVWHTAMSAKIGAHKAIVDGDKRAAAAGFREFMKYLQDTGDDIQDPVSGATRPIEEVLAFNAVRISKLLAEAGDAEESAAAVEEARGLYQAALAKVEEGSADAERIETAIAELEPAAVAP